MAAVKAAGTSEERPKGAVVVVGSCNADLCTYTPRFPAPGETLLGTEFAQGCGGKGANQAVMAAKLGVATVSFVGCIGDDGQGRMMRDAMEAVGIDSKELVTATDGKATGVATILIDASGENCIVVAPGANANVDEAFVRGAGPRRAIEGASVLVTQNEIPGEGTEAALAIAASAAAASSRGTPVTVANPAPAPEALPESAKTDVDVLVLNESEAAALAHAAGADGFSAEGEDGGAEAVARVLRPRHVSRPRVLVLTRGSKGASVVVVPSEAEAGAVTEVSVVEGVPAAAVVDTVGAGDAFAGTLAAVLAASEDPLARIGSMERMREAVRRSCTVASMSVGRKGTQSSYPSRADVEAIDASIIVSL
ncbi:hypothetical protein FNF28_02842 [Cafeteria roenbergensis]|uniref:Ribokinase n=1 Tax=Cafeteria roenbergensis TaxID=33653 RepID=A0A5A8DTY7_CAFRO|nr:hypothetical protein FNF28_02842 [Cafeteria roenbergensis]